MGAAWLFGVQVLTGIVQLGYAAFTSRHADQVAFGQYAIALSATALVSMVANSGLGGSASRMSSTEESEVRALISLSLLIGACMALLLLAVAEPWARLWGNLEAAPVIRLLALGVAVTPATSVQAGVLRREGQFRQFAQAAIGASVGGMMVGMLVVSRDPSASSLAVMSVVANWILLLGLGIILGRKSRPSASLKGTREHMVFGSKSLLHSLIIYAGAAAPLIAMSRSLSVGALGQWNRATVIGQMPLEMATSSAQKALYPEFRGAQADRGRLKRVWTDVVALGAMVVWPLVGWGTAIVPTGLSLIFGPGWQTAGSMARWILVATGLAFVYGILGAAQESANYFRYVWAGSIATSSVLVVSAFFVLETQTWAAIGVGVVIASITGLLVQLVLSIRNGLLFCKDIVSVVVLSLAAGVTVYLLTDRLIRASELPAMGIFGGLVMLMVLYIALYELFPHNLLSRIIRGYRPR